MNDNLRELSELLREGQKRSQQGSYQRRAPTEAAVTYLRHARQGLRLIVETAPGNVEAWRLLSQAEGALLDYRLARIALEKFWHRKPTLTNATSRSSLCFESARAGGRGSDSHLRN
jgi:hypothetical protein